MATTTEELRLVVEAEVDKAIANLKKTGQAKDDLKKKSQSLSSVFKQEMGDAMNLGSAMKRDRKSVV